MCAVLVHSFAAGDGSEAVPVFRAGAGVTELICPRIRLLGGQMRMIGSRHAITAPTAAARAMNVMIHAAIRVAAGRGRAAAAVRRSIAVTGGRVTPGSAA